MSVYMQGYAFCEYVDPGCTDDAINSLNSRNIDRRTLTVKRAKETAQPAHPQRSTTAVAAVSQATSQLGLPQSPHTAQSMPHGLPQSQHSMQSMTQGALQPQHSMQSAQGMPRSQHQAPSTQTVPQQGLHQAQHTVSSAQGVSSEAVHAAQLRAGPQMVHPQGQMGPPNGPSTIPRGQFYPQAPVPLPRDQPNPQGAASRPSMQGRGAGPSQRGFYIQQRHPGSESR